MWNILNFEISRMRERHWKRNQMFFSDYWLCKIPYKGISTLYLLFDADLLLAKISSILA